MTHALLKLLSGETKKLKEAGLYKRPVLPERSSGSAEAIDFTSYDYLGLHGDGRLEDAASQALREQGLSAALSGPMPRRGPLEEALEESTAQLVGQPAAAIFPSGYAANVGFFESLFDSRDCVFCDAWVHPSVGAGVRLSGAREVAYRATDLGELEDRLKRSRAARFRAIAIDGVCAIRGEPADLVGICDLAERYGALVVVDDALGVGVLGQGGSGTASMRGVLERVHVVTGSFGKALGAGGGGFVAAAEEIVDWIRQKSQPYLFSRPLSPVHAAAAQRAIKLLTTGELPTRELSDRVQRMERGLRERGFRLIGGGHPCLTVMVGDVLTLQRMITQLYDAGVQANGLCYPVVPEREARLRLQVRASHDTDSLDQALEVMKTVGQELQVV